MLFCVINCKNNNKRIACGIPFSSYVIGICVISEEVGIRKITYISVTRRFVVQVFRQKNYDLCFTICDLSSLFVFPFS